MHKKTNILLLATLAFELFFSPSALANKNIPTKKNEKTALYLNWKAEPEFGGFYSGLINDEYKKQGIDLEIKEGGSGTPTVQMLTSGVAEFAIISAEELVMAHDKKSKNKPIALFSVYQKSPYVLMAHKGRYKNLKDAYLNSEILSVQSGLPYFKFLEKKYGLRKNKVVPYQGGVAFFVKNPGLVQQGFLSIEPLVAEKNGTATDTFLISESGFNPYLVVLATSEEVLRNKPELVKKMISASKSGWEIYLKTSLPTNKYMVELNTAFSLDLFEKGSEIQKNLITSSTATLGSISEDRLKELVVQLKELKLIEADIPVKNLYYKP